jgi:long-chain acyl-CoA synthetase
VHLERLTAADSEVRQRRAVDALATRRIGRGDRVAIVALGSGDLVSLVIGALRVGVVPVLLNPALLPAEQDALLADAEPALVLRGADEVSALVAEGAGGAPVELAPAPLARPMHYTSGTTGVPKGVWSGILSEADGRALLAEEQSLWGFSAADVHLCCAPTYHSAPLRFSTAVLLAGGEVIVVAPFDAAATATAIDAHRPTTAFMAPAAVQRLLAVGEDGSSAVPDLSSFRLLAHAGALCPDGLKQRMLERFPDGSVWEFYGSTEGQFTACPAGDWLTHPGTVGRARPGRELAVDADGTVWCRVPDYARFEYWRDPVKTAAAWRDDAFTVGDLGRLDDEGFLYLDGRRDDLIITGGMNVYPAEVERALQALPGLTEVAVFGAEDEEWGHRVCAAVVGGVTADEVATFAREHLAPYKCPKQVLVVDALPHTTLGKLRRSHLAHDLGLE